ncbi:hypothetical protein CGRA01v4_05623 [Colletotrichum graminicola]|nr:hypothetical protein CGRA01v4_05623 [Colletotrichum graminicola]
MADLGSICRTKVPAWYHNATDRMLRQSINTPSLMQYG